MEKIIDCSGFETIVENVMPTRVVLHGGVENPEELLVEKRAGISFRTDCCARFTGKGSFVVLDFGKELCGSLRLLVRDIAQMGGNFRITLGESVSEACSELGGRKNATNDHSPRDFVAYVSLMSDVQYGLSGFRFARLELLEDKPALVQNVFAQSRLQSFEQEAVFTCSDEALKNIFDTAAYTIKLCYQNGYIWDGIKRDRLVWAGDLHQEVVSGLYLFGKTVNVPNSLEFLRECTPDAQWINHIPNYSAWWVVNFCDWCSMAKDDAFFEKHVDYAHYIMNKINVCIDESGVVKFNEKGGGMDYFLDWPTCETPDAEPGTVAMLCFAAQKMLAMTEDTAARDILRKLMPRLTEKNARKQTRAFQILAGREEAGDLAFLEEGGAAGFSTFMAYYILKAMAKLQGDQMLPMIKEYFGGMLSRGATTFWEDFDIKWLENSSRIDELPKKGELDLHGDFGAFCYVGLRHSFCHGWSGGVTAFIIEHMLGLELLDGYKRIRVTPHALGVQHLRADLPTPYGTLTIDVTDGKAKVIAPEGIAVEA